MGRILLRYHFGLEDDVDAEMIVDKLLNTITGTLTVIRVDIVQHAYNDGKGPQKDSNDLSISLYNHKIQEMYPNLLTVMATSAHPTKLVGEYILSRSEWDNYFSERNRISVDFQKKRLP